MTRVDLLQNAIRANYSEAFLINFKGSVLGTITILDYHIVSFGGRTLQDLGNRGGAIVDSYTGRTIRRAKVGREKSVFSGARSAKIVIKPQGLSR